MPAAVSAPTALVPEVQNVTQQAAVETPQAVSAQAAPGAKNLTAAASVLPAANTLPQNAAPQNQVSAETQAASAIAQSASIPTAQPAALTAAPILEKAEAAPLSKAPAAASPVTQQVLNQAIPQNSTAEKSQQTAPLPVHTEESAHIDSGSLANETESLPGKQPENETGLNTKPQATLTDLMHSGNVIIKISDVPQSSPKPAVHQVADKIAQNFKAGTPKFEMDLYPKDLGKVTVKMAMENGTLTVEIAASNPKTQSMILSDSGGIRSMIESTVNHPVQITQPSQSSQDKQWYQQGQDQSHSQQQQERQQREASVSRVNDDAELNTDDFLSVMQQLRMKAYTV